MVVSPGGPPLPSCAPGFDEGGAAPPVDEGSAASIQLDEGGSSSSTSLIEGCSSSTSSTQRLEQLPPARMKGGSNLHQL